LYHLPHSLLQHWLTLILSAGLDERPCRTPTLLPLHPLITSRLDIHSLKEMTLLPLLYPAVFQRFNVTPHAASHSMAEIQLRLLFEEAKNSPPSIIFFDEIDGPAPMRLSKQIRSTLPSSLHCSPSWMEWMAVGRSLSLALPTDQVPSIPH
jgi:hypothetical protein